MLRIAPALSLIAMASTLSACATIVDGTTQPVTFNSEPNRAKILINGVPVGLTPLTIPVKRAKHTLIVAKKDGYEEQQLPLQTKMNSYFWGNFICGGFLGSTIDYASDAMVEYSPNMYYISLEPLRKSEADTNRLGYEKKVRMFILVNHARLTQDLAQGKGEYLSSLYLLLAVREPQHLETLRRLRIVSASHQDPPAFAEAVVNAFVRG